MADIDIHMTHAIHLYNIVNVTTIFNVNLTVKYVKSHGFIPYRFQCLTRCINWFQIITYNIHEVWSKATFLLHDIIFFFFVAHLIVHHDIVFFNASESRVALQVLLFGVFCKYFLVVHLHFTSWTVLLQMMFKCVVFSVPPPPVEMLVHFRHSPRARVSGQAAVQKHTHVTHYVEF